MSASLLSQAVITRPRIYNSVNNRPLRLFGREIAFLYGGVSAELRAVPSVRTPEQFRKRGGLRSEPVPGSWYLSVCTVLMVMVPGAAYQGVPRCT